MGKRRREKKEKGFSSYLSIAHKLSDAALCREKMRKKKEKNEEKREIGQRDFEGMGKDERG